MNTSLPTSRTLTVEGRTLSWREAGSGEPVLLLHSGGFSSRQWRKLADTLAASHRVLTPDLLGYGASSPWPVGEPFHPRQEIAALERLLDDVGAPVHLVGHSYGGYLALQLALARPGNVRSLALFDPVAFGALTPADRAELGMDTLAPYDASRGVDEVWLARFIELWNGPGAWKSLHPTTQEEFRRVGWKVSEEVAGLLADTTSLATYARVSVPTLLLGGRLTPLFEQRVLERLGGALPRVRLELLPDMGHMGPITHAPLVNAAIVAHVHGAGAL